VRRSVSAEWKVSHRWGHQIGDIREYTIVRSGDRVTVHGLKSGDTLPREIAQQIGEAMVAAAAWEDQKDGA
jgi:hypothetical protein